MHKFKNRSLEQTTSVVVGINTQQDATVSLLSATKAITGAPSKVPATSPEWQLTTRTPSLRACRWTRWYCSLKPAHGLPTHPAAWPHVLHSYTRLHRAAQTAGLLGERAVLMYACSYKY